MLDDRDSTRLRRFSEDTHAVLGQQLRAVLLYGEAATSAYRSGHTALTTALLVTDASPQLVRLMLGPVAKWRRRGLPVPLLLDDAHLRTSRDVFPLELLAIHDQHMLVWGQHDPLADSPVGPGNREHLRLEVEEHLKGKLLHLRQAYLEAGGRRRTLRAVLLDAVVGFELVLRGLLCVAGAPRPEGGAELLRAAGAVCDIDLPALAQIREGRARGTLPLAEVDALFASALEEAAALAGAADRYFKAPGEP